MNVTKEQADKVIAALAVLWFAFSIFSLLLWAFTGLAMWAPTNGSFREAVLGLFYMGGIAVPILYWVNK